MASDDLRPETRAAWDRLVEAAEAYRAAIDADPAAEPDHREFVSITAPARLGADVVQSVAAYCRATNQEETN